MTIVFVPSLIALLLSKEQEKGSLLTEEEVLSIRDDATAMIVDREVALKIAESRGYHDINPDNCWAEWCEFKGKS